MSYIVDLNEYFNHAMVKSNFWDMYSMDDKISIYGVPHQYNIHIVDDIFMKYQFGDIDFKIEKNSITQYDNIICDGQTIKINNSDVFKLSIMGFCEYGTVKESIKLYGDDNYVIDFVLKTFHTDAYKGLNDTGYNTTCKIGTKILGDDGQKHPVYYWSKADFHFSNVYKIELPTNLSLHIFSLSIN